MTEKVVNPGNYLCTALSNASRSGSGAEDLSDMPALKAVILSDEHREQLRTEGTDVKQALMQAVDDVNHHLPAYCRIAGFECLSAEFEKTPKRSIKRYLYQ